MRLRLPSSRKMLRRWVIISSPFVVSLGSVITNVDVIDSFALDIAQPSGLGDVLGGIPGVRSSFFGPGASRPIIRGLAGPRVQVLTNGIGTIDASALSPDHAVASDPGGAQRIEVLRGPAALAYGGSAIGGVVNVIDERIARGAAEDGIDGRLTASGTTVNDGYSTSGSLKFGSGPIVFTFDGLHRNAGDYDIPGFAESRFQMALEEEEHEDDDHDDGEHHEEGEEAFGTVPNSGVGLTVLGGGVSHVTNRGFLGFSIKHTDSLYGVPGHAHGHGEEEHEDEVEHEDEDHEDEDGQAHAEEEVAIDLKQLRLDLHGERELNLGPFGLVRFASGYSDYEHVELEGRAVGTRFLSDGYEARLELVQEDRDGWQGAVGFQGSKRNFDAIGAEAYVPKTTIGEIGAFTQQRLDRAGWGIEGGVRLDNRNLDSLVGERSFTNFSASAGAFLRPSDPWFLGISLSRTARAPREEDCSPTDRISQRALSRSATRRSVRRSPIRRIHRFTMTAACSLPTSIFSLRIMTASSTWYPPARSKTGWMYSVHAKLMPIFMALNWTQPTVWEMGTRSVRWKALTNGTCRNLLENHL